MRLGLVDGVAQHFSVPSASIVWQLIIVTGCMRLLCQVQVAWLAPGTSARSDAGLLTTLKSIAYNREMSLSQQSRSLDGDL